MLGEILERFGITDAEITDNTKGHINTTYSVNSGGERYILQGVNDSVFPDPLLIMRNIAKIKAAFDSSLEYWVKIPEYLECEGRNFLEYEGKIWRIYRYAERAAAADDRRHGHAVGRFINVMSSSGAELEDPLPRLHAFELPGIPKRSIHGDTKGDNIILGNIFTTVIDLDTAKQGYVCADYGDMIRSVTRFPSDTEGELELWRIDEATRGFAEGLDGILTPGEADSLFEGIIRITEELAERYLNDAEGRTREFPNRSIDHCRKRYDELIRQRELFLANEKAIR